MLHLPLWLLSLFSALALALSSNDLTCPEPTEFFSKAETKIIWPGPSRYLGTVNTSAIFYINANPVFGAPIWTPLFGLTAVAVQRYYPRLGTQEGRIYYDIGGNLTLAAVWYFRHLTDDKWCYNYTNNDLLQSRYPIGVAGQADNLFFGPYLVSKASAVPGGLLPGAATGFEYFVHHNKDNSSDCFTTLDSTRLVDMLCLAFTKVSDDPAGSGKRDAPDDPDFLDNVVTVPDSVPRVRVGNMVVPITGIPSAARAHMLANYPVAGQSKRRSDH
jgi:hypothetical protein